MLKKANPDGRFWIKIDGTDVKTALMESMRGKWNGDVDLGDGALEKLRKEYDIRLKDITALTDKELTKENIVCKLSEFTKLLSTDVNFLTENFTIAVKTYKEKFKAVNTPVKTLKDCNWDVVEYQTLLQDAQAIKSTCEKGINELAVCCDERKFKSCKAMLKDHASNIKAYTRNLFKKKRAAASHVEVIMISDEKRNCKPYALPVKFVPCQTLKDKQVRELNSEIKRKMTEYGLKVVGWYRYTL